MFSGQGSQYLNMGRDLFDQSLVFQSWMRRLDGHVQQMTGASVLDQLYGGDASDAGKFKNALHTNPAIFMVEYALAQTLIEGGVIPDLTLGASMGGFAAAAVAGHIDASDALWCAIEQARIFEAHCAPGGMVAILSDPILYQEELLRRGATIASYNYANSFVVAADAESMDNIIEFLREQKIAHQRLDVNFAYHSPALDVAKPHFLAKWNAIVKRTGNLQLVCCARAEIFRELPPDFMWHAARQPIQFARTCAYLETHGEYRYIDLGPTGTLATFLKYVLPARSESRTQMVMTPFGSDMNNLRALIG